MAAHEREGENREDQTTRRSFLGAVAAAGAASAAGATLLKSEVAEAAKDSNAVPNLAASPPPGFTPFAAPGRIVKVTKPGSLQNNKVYPKPDAAKEMLTKVLTELTGEPDLPKAAARFVHPDDKVCVKVNGIALRNHATNQELVIPFLEAMIASGVPAKNITVLEQYGSYLQGTRINEKNVPAGVKISIHSNGDTTMPERLIPGTGVRTKFCRALTESTAVINFSLIKDHSICGYTGCLKNMTHGTQIYPHYFHSHHASPQIAVLYAQDIIKSRVRLCITDAFQVMVHGGPLDKQPQYRYPYESVFATTDPVAMDTLGWEIIEKFRADKGLKSLTAEGREPAYIKAAADLGLGIHERAQIQVKEIAI
ncbi:DUF362 domain-containing protein [Pendulispora rubella]|uniref:DUF362 domain-containing protein n=1 Tax=Pendulispora rubella TaxID=2741070 RepID=A0ABZ2L6P0_9BACT